MRLQAGQSVILRGLKKAQDLDGQRGVAVRYQADAGRYAARAAEKKVAVRRGNLAIGLGAAERVRVVVPAAAEGG